MNNNATGKSMIWYYFYNINSIICLNTISLKKCTLNFLIICFIHILRKSNIFTHNTIDY